MIMLTYFVELLGLVIFASVMQNNYKIPSPITLISSVLLLKIFHVSLFSVSEQDFDMLVIITLPLLIGADALKLKWEDLRKNWFSLAWVTIVSVICAIGAGALLNEYVITDYSLSWVAVVMLFCMVTATDPITVSAIFANFKVPHKLKVLAEGESLFNDATVLIVFSIALVLLSSPEKVGFMYVAEKSFVVMIGALVVGLLVGYMTVWALKLSEEALVEAAILIFAAYSAYLIAEHFHMSGILAVIVAMVVANKKIQAIIRGDENEINKSRNNFALLKHAIADKANHEIIMKVIDFVAMFAGAVLFLSVAILVNFADVLLHWKEIVSVFVFSTIIRGVMMLKFAVVSNKVSHMQSINPRWWSVLTFAGSKGALSILMVHMIPASFEYRKLFETIIIGNIILSTFVYAFILAIIMWKYKSAFEQECLEDDH